MKFGTVTHIGSLQRMQLIIMLTNKIANIIETTLASVSVCYKSHCFKTANIKILSTHYHRS